MYIIIFYILSSSLAIVCVRNAREEGDNRQVLPFVPIQSIPKASQIPTSCRANFFLQLCTELLYFCTASSSNTTPFAILPSYPFQNNVVELLCVQKFCPFLQMLFINCTGYQHFGRWRGIIINSSLLWSSCTGGTIFAISRALVVHRRQPDGIGLSPGLSSVWGGKLRSCETQQIVTMLDSATVGIHGHQKDWAIFLQRRCGRAW